MTKSLLFLSFLLLVSCDSTVSEGTYKVYQCETKSEALVCAKTCDSEGLTKDVTYDFDVTSKANVVIHKTYRTNNNSQHTLEGCKVTDKNNWSCEGFKAFNGKNYDFHYLHKGNKFSVIYGDNANHKLYVCAIQ